MGKIYYSGLTKTWMKVSWVFLNIFFCLKFKNLSTVENVSLNLHHNQNYLKQIPQEPEF